MIYPILYGILIAFIAYFAVLAVRLKNASAGWFTLYLFCFGFIWFLYSSLRLNSSGTIFSGLNPAILISFIGLFYFTGTKFLRTFLNVRAYSAGLDRIMLVVQWMGIGFVPFNFFPNPFSLLFNVIVAGIGPIFLSGVSIFLWSQGNPSLRNFTIGWVTIQTTFAILLPGIFNWVPILQGINWLLPAAFFFSMVFFGIAILERNDANLKYDFIDTMTGIANRRLFDQVLTIEWNRNLRKQLPLSVIMAGMDNFRTFHDTYGQLQSQKCLKTVADIFDRNLQRAGDFTARYGKEEFAAVLPDTTASEAFFLAEKIRDAVEALAINYAPPFTGKILTISMGAGSLVPNAENEPDDIMLLADKALFQAQNNGGNRIVSIDQA